MLNQHQFQPPALFDIADSLSSIEDSANEISNTITTVLASPIPIAFSDALEMFEHLQKILLLMLKKALFS